MRHSVHIRKHKKTENEGRKIFGRILCPVQVTSEEIRGYYDLEEIIYSIKNLRKIRNKKLEATVGKRLVSYWRNTPVLLPKGQIKKVQMEFLLYKVSVFPLESKKSKYSKNSQVDHKIRLSVSD